jgi:serine/threonine protein kinase/tetratricopeptide (TPR) repeat protein
MSFSVGDRVGAFEILGHLGSGGMGEVYLANDTVLNRHVAIKFLTGSSDVLSKSRLLREARAAASLDHPNVCAIYEVGEHDNQSYVTMQYVEGETLAQRLTRGPLTVAQARGVATQLADALAEAHAQGIVHRDIKPQNIMLTPRGQVKVLDFGLAKRSTLPDAATLTDTDFGAIAGTLSYMSPEQLRGEPLDPSSDIFSFGCVVYEMLSGRDPFTRSSSAQTISAILTESPPPLEASVARDLERIVRKCLEKDRTRRYASAAAVIADLRKREDPITPPRMMSVVLAHGRRSRALIIGAVAAVAVIVASWSHWFGGRTVKDGSPIIAILPLFTPEESSAYLGDGISESVINSLTRLRGIRVLARTTTFRYRGENVNPAALRRELGVDAVLTGTVSQRGTDLVVQAELINTADNTQIWGDRYNRPVSNVFDVQEDIARAIASKLHVELTNRVGGFTKRYTDDVQAYRAYVLGREYAQRHTIPDLNNAVDHFKQAISRDPRYALAWAGLTDAYINLWSRGSLPFSEGRRMALEAAEHARTLDPDLAEAHAAIGQTNVFVGPFNFQAGDDALSRAIELNPGWALARQYQAVSLLAQGRQRDAIDQLKIAHDLDPLSGFITRFLAYAHLLKDDRPAAVDTYRAARAQGPLFSTIWESEFFVRVGAIDEGLAELKTAAIGREEDADIRFHYARLSAGRGDRGHALTVANQFDDESITSPISARFASRLYVALGEHDRGLDSLARMINAGAVPIFYKDDPVWKPVRQHPRFVALLRSMRIPE